MDDIAHMVGFQLNIHWWICWTFITPVLMLVRVVFHCLHLTTNPRFAVVHDCFQRRTIIITTQAKVAHADSAPFRALFYSDNSRGSLYFSDHTGVQYVRVHPTVVRWLRSAWLGTGSGLDDDRGFCHTDTGRCCLQDLQDLQEQRLWWSQHSAGRNIRVVMLRMCVSGLVLHGTCVLSPLRDPNAGSPYPYHVVTQCEISDSPEGVQTKCKNVD